MADTSARLYRDYTRYLRPVRAISFTDIEMLQSVVQCLDPEDIASVAQLLGTKRGVIRITMKTIEGIVRLEEAVQRRRLTVAGSPFGIVEDGGQFILVQLDNVPQYVTDEQVEQEMAKYGVVASCSKDYIEVRGCRIENERRNVLYTMVFNRAAITGGELKLFGATVYVKAPYDDLQTTSDEEAGTSASAATGTSSAESSDRSAPGESSQLLQATNRQQQLPSVVHTSPSGTRRSGIFKTSADGGSSWKKTAILATVQNGGDIQQPLTVDQISTASMSQNSSVAVGGDQQQHGTAEQITARMGTRNSIVGGRSGVAHVGFDARQRQKRSEAFEQLSAFLQ